MTNLKWLKDVKQKVKKMRQFFTVKVITTGEPYWPRFS